MTDDSLSKQEREEGKTFAPKFDDNGLVPVVTTHADSGDVLMMAYMNEAALRKTIETGQAHYWSRSRNELWHKGATSGQVQMVEDIRTDCDQDAIWIKVRPQGDGGCCHVGFESCFYRSMPVGGAALTRNEVKKLR